MLNFCSCYLIPKVVLTDKLATLFLCQSVVVYLNVVSANRSIAFDSFAFLTVRSQINQPLSVFLVEFAIEMLKTATRTQLGQFRILLEHVFDFIAHYLHLAFPLITHHQIL